MPKKSSLRGNSLPKNTNNSFDFVNKMTYECHRSLTVQAGIIPNANAPANEWRGVCGAAR
jgi:hypothetical protein